MLFLNPEYFGKGYMLAGYFSTKNQFYLSFMVRKILLPYTIVILVTLWPIFIFEISLYFAYP